MLQRSFVYVSVSSSESPLVATRRFRGTRRGDPAAPCRYRLKKLEAPNIGSKEVMRVDPGLYRLQLTGGWAIKGADAFLVADDIDVTARNCQRRKF